MSLLDMIRADALAARKAKAPTSGVLVTLIGEIDTKTKTFSPARAMSDDEVVAIVKKFLKSNAEARANLASVSGSEAKVAQLVLEADALEIYLPSQLGEDELRALISGLAEEGKAMGEIMGALKADHAGRYDGKLASGLAREILAKKPN